MKTIIRWVFFTLSVVWGSLSIAAPSVWALKFYNEVGELNGAGKFTYDTSTSQCIELLQGACSSSDPILTNIPKYSTLIDSIVITFDDSGLTYERLKGVSWWARGVGGVPGRTEPKPIDDKSIIKTNARAVSGWVLEKKLETETKILSMKVFKMTSECLWVGEWDEKSQAHLVKTGAGHFTASNTSCRSSVVGEGTGSALLPHFSVEPGVLNIPTVVLTEANTLYAVTMQLNPQSIEKMLFSITDMKVLKIGGATGSALLPHFSVESGVLNIPTVVLTETGIPYAVKMQLDTTSTEQMFFSITEALEQ